MATGIEQTFLDRLKQRTGVIFSQTTWDKYFKDTELKDLVLDPGFTYNEADGITRGKVINYHSKILLNNVSWRRSKLGEIIDGSRVYSGKPLDFFTGASDKVYVNHDSGICLAYLNDPALSIEITEQQFKDKLHTLLTNLTGFDFSDIGTMLNLQHSEYTFGKEFPDYPTQVSEGAFVGGIKLEGQIVNGVLYIVDVPVKALATENSKGILKEWA